MVLAYLLAASQERKHFGAMYSQVHSHRDKPMRNLGFLRAMMQTDEPAAAEAEWPAAHVVAAAPGGKG